VIDDIHPHDIGTILDQEASPSEPDITVPSGDETIQRPGHRARFVAFYNTKEEIDTLAGDWTGY